MEKSINSRFYFDYNATSPLSNKVVNFLKSGEFFYGNPSSLHFDGKQAKKAISGTTKYLHDLFNLSSESFNLIFHSGASEGINFFFKGMAVHGQMNSQKFCFWFSTVDHPCAFNLKDSLEFYGHSVRFFKVDRNGEFDLDELILEIKNLENQKIESIINYTIVNNETGVYWPIHLAEKIKTHTRALIHVDAVQIVGKVSNWNNLSSLIDAYTFSGHKFGALKGIGFTFIKKLLEIEPLIHGGNQQLGFRAGTENALGVYSLQLALEDLMSSFNSNSLEAAKRLIEKNILTLVDQKGEVVSLNAKYRNLNTIFLLLRGKKADILSAKFDLEGISLSTGSACSSGIIRENRVLINMGYSQEDSKSALRFSFSPLMNIEQAQKFSDKILSVLKSII